MYKESIFINKINNKDYDIIKTNHYEKHMESKAQKGNLSFKMTSNIMGKFKP
jgi:hypothetical protein